VRECGARLDDLDHSTGGEGGEGGGEGGSQSDIASVLKRLECAYATLVLESEAAQSASKAFLDNPALSVREG
jgi:hypothetical protein